MSRIGKRAIALPSGVEVQLAEGEIRVKGPKGQLRRPLPRGIEAELGEGQLRFKRPDDKKENRALHGLARALGANMVQGVSEGFTKSLEIEGVGYRADVQGQKLNLVVGFSHPVEMQVPDGLKVSMEGNTRINVEGIDKELVGQFAADVRAIRPPEPYKGKGIRYAGERVRRKVGKAGAT
jgi:large subunit ribosomal protein L6